MRLSSGGAVATPDLVRAPPPTRGRPFVHRCLARAPPSSTRQSRARPHAVPARGTGRRYSLPLRWRALRRRHIALARFVAVGCERERGEEGNGVGFRGGSCRAVVLFHAHVLLSCWIRDRWLISLAESQTGRQRLMGQFWLWAPAQVKF